MIKDSTSYVMKNKIDLLIIISVITILSIVSIIIFNLKFGTIKIGSQLLRLGFNLLLSYFLYQEKQWARWIFVILFFIAGAAGLSIILNDPITINNIPLIAMGLFYAGAAVYLAFIRKWHKTEQKA